MTDSELQSEDAPLEPPEGGKGLALLQLVRIPTVFTAMADIFLGFLLTHSTLEPASTFAFLLGASVCIYWTGMILNDYFDRDVDGQERPGRPDRPEGFKRPDRPKRIERPDRPKRPDRPERIRRAERPKRPERVERPER